jgi:hypothetical protein
MLRVVEFAFFGREEISVARSVFIEASSTRAQVIWPSIDPLDIGSKRQDCKGWWEDRLRQDDRPWEKPLNTAVLRA